MESQSAFHFLKMTLQLTSNHTSLLKRIVVIIFVYYLVCRETKQDRAQTKCVFLFWQQ